MLGQQFTTILARTDPFDVAQGLERHIRQLDAKDVRALIEAAAPRMNDWYRSEFVPLLDDTDDERLRSAFAHSLKSNLRAIPLFGPNFCEDVIAKIPADRTVGLGEEPYSGRRLRPAAFAVIAIALLIGGAAAEHVISTARANASTPVVLFTPPPAAVLPSSAPAPQKIVAARPKRSTPSPAVAAPPPRRVAVAPVAAPPPQAPQIRTPVERPVAVRPVHVLPAPRKESAHLVPAGSGVKTIVAGEPRPTPAPEPTPVDVNDMPQAYSDATPLPADAAPSAAIVSAPAMRVATPTPAPNRSWTHRLVHAAVHLVNSTLTTVGVSKKPAQPTPSASPPGPRP